MQTLQFRQLFLFFSWLITVFGLVITQYSAIAMHMPVCPLCWYQRVCLYPLVIILGIGAYNDDYKVIRYALPLTIIGALFALYHYAEQMIPGFAPIGFCSSSGVHCNNIHFQWLGYITYPMLSFMAFVAISVLLVISRRLSKNAT
jgi:disulfide bond formation protein DsbB